MALRPNISPRCDNCGMTQTLWGVKQGIKTLEGIFCCQGCADALECTCGPQPLLSDPVEQQEERSIGRALLEREEMLTPTLAQDETSEIDRPKDLELHVRNAPRKKSPPKKVLKLKIQKRRKFVR